MRQQVLIPDHTQGIVGKKSLSKAVKGGDDFVENGRRLVGDGPSLDEEKLALKMPGGRLKGSSAYHSKEHKGSKEQKDHRDRKDEKDSKDYNDHSSKAEEDVEVKAPEATEAMDEEAEGHNRRGQDGETLLQWGQRKRPRYREPTGLLKTSIRADRRVVRADKQVAAQPASQSRGNVVRPPNATVPEVASGTAKRTSDGFGSAVMYSEFDHFQSSSGNQPQSGDQEEYRQQHQGVAYNPEKAPASNTGGHIVTAPLSLRRADEAPTSNSGGHTVAAPPSLRRADGESLQEKSLGGEKTNLELFEWPKIVTSLTRKEKEDDFTAIKGTKLPQRPKRRPKTVEKNVQFISPGTWLCDLTRERYEVREKKAVKKKPRGLKAMGSVDSDSE